MQHVQEHEPLVPGAPAPRTIRPPMAPIEAITFVILVLSSVPIVLLIWMASIAVARWIW